MSALVTGVDVSHWQTPSMQLANQRAAFGDRFAIVKAADGIGSDRAARAHVANFKAAGLAVGAYIFYRSSKDPRAQARHLMDATAGLGLTAGLWLDYENGSGADDPDDLWAFLTTLDAIYSGTVGIYTGPAWWKQTIGNDARFARFPLWLAQYPNRYKDGTTTPESISAPSPDPWKVVDVWQFTDSAGHLDRNVCTPATFARITGSHPAPPPVQEDDMTPAQEAKIDALNKKLDEALPILRKLDSDYLTRGKSVRQAIVHTESLAEDIASGKRPAKA